MASILRSILMLSLLSETHAQYKCKPTLGSRDWPSVSAWNALNTTISGRLQSLVIPGAVCYPSRPEFSSDQCTDVTSQWSNTSFHASNPVSVDYNDDTCAPEGNKTCSGGGYPAYVIDVHNACDIQSGINFARETGVRLVIKATGHDLVGRYVMLSISEIQELNRAEQTIDRLVQTRFLSTHITCEASS
jgi:hypothetical protein